MNKIQKISSYLLVIFNLLLIALPLFVIITWYFIDTYTIWQLSLGILQNPFQLQDNVSWTLLYKIIGAIGHIISLLPLFLSLFILKSIFQNYKNGEIFSTSNAIHYKRLGWLCFLNALLANPVGNGIMIMSTTLSNPPGERCLNIIFGYPSLEGLFCGAILIVISLVMVEASKLNDEQKFTV